MRAQSRLKSETDLVRTRIDRNDDVCTATNTPGAHDLNRSHYKAIILLNMTILVNVAAVLCNR